MEVRVMARKMALLMAVAAFLFFGEALAQDELIAEISIDRLAKVSSDHLVATITGTYRCTLDPQPGGFNLATISGNLAQASGRQIATGSLQFQPLCDGEVQPLELGIHAGNIPWHGGKARVTANLNVQRCTFLCEFASASVDQQISLRGNGN